MCGEGEVFFGTLLNYNASQKKIKRERERESGVSRRYGNTGGACSYSKTVIPPFCAKIFGQTIIFLVATGKQH